MRSEVERQLAMEWKANGISYTEIARLLHISRNVAINLCLYRPKNIKKITGPKLKIGKSTQLQIKRKIAQLKSSGEKINAPKIRNECGLDVSVSTVQRHLRRSGYIFKRVKLKISLTKKEKQKRVEMIKSWISSNHKWEHTIFSDEKRFSLDGPDDWRSYLIPSEKLYRQRKQCKGGGVILWMMVMPNGLMTFRVVKGNLNSNGYI